MRSRERSILTRLPARRGVSVLGLREQSASDGTQCVHFGDRDPGVRRVVPSEASLLGAWMADSSLCPHMVIPLHIRVLIFS